jgi:hypothetical protein
MHKRLERSSKRTISQHHDQASKQIRKEKYHEARNYTNTNLIQWHEYNQHHNTTIGASSSSDQTTPTKTTKTINYINIMENHYAHPSKKYYPQEKIISDYL